jgi:hypothetical protein
VCDVPATHEFVSWSNELNVRQSPASKGRVGSVYQATTSEDAADWEILVRPAVNC